MIPCFETLSGCAVPFDAHLPMILIPIIMFGILIPIGIIFYYRSKNDKTESPKQYSCYLCNKPEYEYRGKFINIIYGTYEQWLCKTCKSKLANITQKESREQ